MQQSDLVRQDTEKVALVRRGSSISGKMVVVQGQRWDGQKSTIKRSASEGGVDHSFRKHDSFFEDPTVTSSNEREREAHGKVGGCFAFCLFVVWFCFLNKDLEQF